MSLRLLSCNVRGLNNPQKREVCKNLLKEWKCDIVCFLETKLSSLNSFVVRSLWGSPFLDWVVLDAVNIAGGVLLVWDKRVFEKVDCVVGLFFVNVLLKGVADDFVWACSRVYGPNKDNLQGALWEELSSMHSR